MYLLDVTSEVQLGTLADAWKRCPLIDFERDLCQISSACLERMASEYVQAGTNDPTVILNNLQRWREKWLAARQQNASISTLEKLQDVCEAVRAKARLLYLKEKGAAWQNAPAERRDRDLAVAAAAAAATGGEGGDASYQQQLRLLEQQERMLQQQQQMLQEQQQMLMQQRVMLERQQNANGARTAQGDVGGNGPLAALPAAPMPPPALALPAAPAAAPAAAAPAATAVPASPAATAMNGV